MSDIHAGNWEGSQYTIFDSPLGTTKNCLVTVCIHEDAADNARLNVDGFNVGEEIPKGVCRTWCAPNARTIGVNAMHSGTISKGTYTVSIV
jgi:hypothetical protein